MLFVEIALLEKERVSLDHQCGVVGLYRVLNSCVEVIDLGFDARALLVEGALF